MIRSSHGSKVLRRILIGALALLVPVLAGCEAGNNAPTLEFHPAANGAYGTADAVTVDNAFILGGRNNTLLASGSSASMFLYLYNGSGSADKLTLGQRARHGNVRTDHGRLGHRARKREQPT